MQKIILKDLLRELNAVRKMCWSLDSETRIAGQKRMVPLMWKFFLYFLKFVSKPLRILFGSLAILLALLPLVPPYVWTSAVLIFIALLLFWFVVPKPLSAEKANKYLAHRIVSYFVFFIIYTNAIDFHESTQLPFMSKRQIEVREEMARERSSERAEEWDSSYSQRETAKRDELEEELALKRERDIKIENKSQSNFYEKMGPPKILYKCNNSEFEMALGAKYGSYNSLLDMVGEKCGAVGYEIIDNEK